MGRPKQPPKTKTGDVFNRLTVVSTEYVDNYHKAVCKCSCGNTIVTREYCLLSGASESCGCLAKELSSKRMTTHGMSNHRLFKVWYEMNRRCYNPKRRDYKHYGGRGIQVCDSWLKENPEGFRNFLNDMEHTFEEGLELDRIDNDKGYCPENCKWSSRSDQVINRRFGENSIGIPVYLDDGEERLHLAAMARKYGLSPKLLQDRVGKLGMSLQYALKLPVKVDRYFVVFDQERFTLQQVFKNAPNVSALATRVGVKMEELLYHYFGNNIIVVGMTQGEEIIFDNNEIELNISNKLPPLNEGFEKYVVRGKS